MSALTFNAKLERTDAGTSWGFRMTGGKDFGAPLTIQRVVPGSLAAKCGLEVDDEIKVIGSTQTEGLRHSEAQQLIRDAKNLVELTIQRGGSTARTADSINAHSSPPDVPSNKPTVLAQNQTCNILPKPFASQTVVSLGSSGTSIGLKTEAPNVYVLSKEGHGTKSFSTTFESTHSAVGDVASEKVDSHSKTTSAKDDFPPPPPLSEVPPTGPPPAQSAQREEQQDSDVPRYQGYVDPSLQSRSFKLLQSAMESGEGISKLTVRNQSPAGGLSPGKKPAIGVKPSVAKETAGPSVKPIKPVVSRQYNSPIGLYSETKVTEAREEQTKEVHTVTDVMIDVPVERKTFVLPSKKTNPSTDDTIDVPVERKTIVLPSKETNPSFDVTFDAPVERKTIVVPSKETNPSFDVTFDAPVERKTIVVPSKETNPSTDVMIDVSVERKTIVVPSKKSNPSPANEPPQDTIDAPTERKKIVISSSKLSKTNGKEDSSSEGLESGKKTYLPSETLKLIQDQESGRPQIQVNPKTGVEVKINQSKKLIQLEKNLDGGFAGGPPVATSYKVTSSIPTETKPAAPPSGTGLTYVGKAGEAKTLPAIVEAFKIPVCVECGTSIRGPYISALDKTWCPDHFVCANPSCRTSLVDVGFVQEEGRLYCERDYELHFAPKCGKCGLGIVSDIICAVNQKFHASCFVCVKCHRPITGGLFHMESGEPYCETDWNIMFQTKCHGCQFPIDDSDPWVDALSRMWHSDCFKCVMCQINLDGQSFYAKNGKPYCKKHGSA